MMRVFPRWLGVEVSSGLWLDVKVLVSRCWGFGQSTRAGAGGARYSSRELRSSRMGTPCRLGGRRGPWAAATNAGPRPVGPPPIAWEQAAWQLGNLRGSNRLRMPDWEIPGESLPSASRQRAMGRVRSICNQRTITRSWRLQPGRARASSGRGTHGVSYLAWWLSASTEAACHMACCGWADYTTWTCLA